jgi:hypothetical protein
MLLIPHHLAIDVNFIPFLPIIDGIRANKKSNLT